MRALGNQTAPKLASLRARLRRTGSNARLYASASHGHDQQHYGPKESLGLGFWIAAAMVPALAVLYGVSQSRPDGSEPVLTRWLERVQSMPEHWADRNAGHTKAREQLAMDTALLNSAKVWTLRPLRFPEAVFFYSPTNVSAGSLANMDQFKEFYRQKYWEEDARRQKNLEAARREAAGGHGKVTPP